MRKLIRWFCLIIGFETSYLITALVKDNSGLRAYTYTCKISPWFHADMYKGLLEHTKKTLGEKGELELSIISVTKIGF